MEKPLIYINPQKAYELDQEIAKSKKVKDRNLALQRLYYHPEGYYRTAEKCEMSVRMLV